MDKTHLNKLIYWTFLRMKSRKLVKVRLYNFFLILNHQKRFLFLHQQLLIFQWLYKWYYQVHHYKNAFISDLFFYLMSFIYLKLIVKEYSSIPSMVSFQETFIELPLTELARNSIGLALKSYINLVKIIIKFLLERIFFRIFFRLFFSFLTFSNFNSIRTSILIGWNCCNNQEIFWLKRWNKLNHNWCSISKFKRIFSQTDYFNISVFTDGNLTKPLVTKTNITR